MKSIRCAIAAAIWALGLGAAAAQPRAFDPRDYQRQVAGELTQVLVLATPHLASAPDSFDPAVLTPLLDRLAAFAPDIIAIEAQPGETLFVLREYSEVYPGTLRTYATRTMTIATAAQLHLGMDMPRAEMAARDALAHLGATPTPAQRRRLAALFLASGDPISAVVQWLRLPASEQIAGGELTDDLATQLTAYGQRRNENQLIAARLAARLGRERVFPMDDHTSDDIQTPIGDTLEQALDADPNWAATLQRPEFARLANAPQHLTSADELLATYRHLNSPQAGIDDARGQWLYLLTRAYPQNVGRQRIAWWETRNLRMVANIREAAASAPGGRVLVIVGSAHKAWIDAYLGQMSDMRIVSAPAILR